MNELERNYKEKSDTLNDLKSLFYRDKESFKKYFHSQSLMQQAKIMAFFQTNDSKFYEEVNKYTGGIKILPPHTRGDFCKERI